MLLERQKLHKMRPAQFSRQCRENLSIRKCLRELRHPEQVLLREPPTKLRHQFSRQCRGMCLARSADIPVRSNGLRGEAVANRPTLAFGSCCGQECPRSAKQIQQGVNEIGWGWWGKAEG